MFKQGDNETQSISDSETVQEFISDYGFANGIYGVIKR